MTQKFRLVGEKESAAEPVFGPEVAGILALAFNPAPTFPATLRRHSLTSFELRDIFKHAPDGEELGREILALEKVHGPIFYIELVE